MNRRGAWALLALIFGALAVYLFTLGETLWVGAGLWSAGLAFLALRQAKGNNTGVDVSQRAAFKGFLRLTLMVGGLGLLFLGWAIFADARAAGLAVLCLGFALLLTIPTVMAYKNRDSDQPWGTNGA